jgi:hypothetical protein
LDEAGVFTGTAEPATGSDALPGGVSVAVGEEKDHTIIDVTRAIVSMPPIIQRIFFIIINVLWTLGCRCWPIIIATLVSIEPLRSLRITFSIARGSAASII